MRDQTGELSALAAHQGEITAMQDQMGESCALADKPLAEEDSRPSCYSRARANATTYLTFILRLSNCLFLK